MKARFTNTEFIEGRLYQHNLTLKKVTNKDSANYGTDFITGTIDIATDEEGLNVIPIHYTYVVETTKAGNKNATFGVLKNIINGAHTWITDGKDKALKVRVNTSLGLNDFYNQNDELISAKRNEGGFVSTVANLVPEDERNRFTFDIVITSVNRVEADEGKNISSDYVTIRGAIFNFRKDILPVELICRDEQGMSYFESLDASSANPVFTEVRGKIVNNTIEHEVEEESAFGSASVKTFTRTVREWQVTWARPTEFDFGEEDTITADDLRTAIQNREVYLADIKKRRDDYLASCAAEAAKPSGFANDAMPIPSGEFDF